MVHMTHDLPIAERVELCEAELAALYVKLFSLEKKIGQLMQIWQKEMVWSGEPITTQSD